MPDVPRTACTPGADDATALAEALALVRDVTETTTFRMSELLAGGDSDAAGAGSPAATKAAVSAVCPDCDDVWMLRETAALALGSGPVCTPNGINSPLACSRPRRLRSSADNRWRPAVALTATGVPSSMAAALTFRLAARPAVNALSAAGVQEAKVKLDREQVLRTTVSFTVTDTARAGTPDEVAMEEATAERLAELRPVTLVRVIAVDKVATTAGGGAGSGGGLGGRGA